MFRSILFFVFISNVFSKNTEEISNERIVNLDIGGLRGEKYWNGDFYTFYGVPYATVPKGRDRFKAPLPVTSWERIKDANDNKIVCEQILLFEDDDDEIIMDGVEDCLTMNLFVPAVANEDNLVPVLVYIHSGAYAGGSGNMAKYDYLVRNDVLVISFNYRLGVRGFACLGTEEIPGNAALKDQVAALKFINKYVKKFGGDPNRITLAGFSVGASMAELLALSKSAGSLIEKLILESGSALSPFAINRDPINSAKNLAIGIGYKDTGKLNDLNEFLLNASIFDLSVQSKNFHLTNGTFGLAPCIERDVLNTEPFLIESPLTTLQKGDFKKIPVLTGFANMEGISRTVMFNDWIDMMNDNFEDFLPADLAFNDDKAKKDFIELLRKEYFNGEEVSHDTIQGYIEYASDSMFKYGIIKSAKLREKKSEGPVFFYEFSYVGKLSFKHYFMDKVHGASHRDQTAYILDFFVHTTEAKDLDTRGRMTAMWTDFVKYENPTVYESLLIDVKWKKYTDEEPNILEIGDNLRMRKDFFPKSYTFWDKIYQKYYWHPTPVAEKET